MSINPNRLPLYASLFYRQPKLGRCQDCRKTLGADEARLRVAYHGGLQTYLCVACAEALEDAGCVCVKEKLAILRKIEAGRLDPTATCNARVVAALEARSGRTCAHTGAHIPQGDPCVIALDWNGAPTHYTLSGAEAHAREVDCSYIFAALTRYRHRQGR